MVIKKLIKQIFRMMEVIYITCRLFILLKKIDHSQPLYYFPVLKNRKWHRPCVDRADTLYQVIRPWGQGGRIVDIGCHLGYFSHFFADRGFVVSGVDDHSAHISVCKLLSRMSQKKTQFRRQFFSLEWIQRICADDYDIGFLFEKLDEVLLEKGVSVASSLLEALLEKIPILCVELTLSDEKPAQLIAGLAKRTDLSIEKMGLFPSQRSVYWRQLFLIKKNTLFLCDAAQTIHEWKFTAYVGAGYYGRHYYDVGHGFVKKYFFPQKNNKKHQVLEEIKNYNRLSENHFFPKLLSYHMQKNSIEMLFTKLPGKNVQEQLVKGDWLAKDEIIMDVIQGLKFLFECGLFHNDIRLWNMIHDGRRTYLFDLGLSAEEETENTNVALLWTINQLYQFNRHVFQYPVTAAPCDWIWDRYPSSIQSIIVALEKTRHFHEFLAWFDESGGLEKDPGCPHLLLKSL